MDSRDNIKQINIQHDNIKHSKVLTEKGTDPNNTNQDKKSSPLLKRQKKHVDLKSDGSNVSTSKEKRKHMQMQTSESHDKVLRLPTPIRNQSLSQSSDICTSSESDSEATRKCPVLVPRWPPINNPRHRRNYRRPQRQEETNKMPFENITGE